LKFQKKECLDFQGKLENYLHHRITTTTKRATTNPTNSTIDITSNTMSSAASNTDTNKGSTASNTSLRPPCRYIYNNDDMERFLESPAKEELMRLTHAMGKACASETSSFIYNAQDPLQGLSPCLASLHGSLTAMIEWLADFPPVHQSLARFGNPSFRNWHERLTRRSVSIVEAILDEHQQHPSLGIYDKDILEEAAERGKQAAGSVEKELESVPLEDDRRAITQELCAYLHDAFGHYVRLDYGTGHECSFQVFLFSLCKLGCFGSTAEQPPTVDRLKAITTSIYSAYLRVCRQLQTDYMLEPAGSHGVWGLDDYHCLPFYFGACQLKADGDDEDHYKPSCIHEPSILNRDAETFLFFGCIQHIKNLKKNVPFFESSPMLNDISHLENWNKVSSGLLRLFEGEVLKKRQVVQHFVFGNIFSANWVPSEEPRREPPSGQATFRTTTPTIRAVPLAPMVRAPWATDEQQNTGSSTSSSSSPMPPTRAPWAK
jgi:Phosphotyrosyl phosphate activator (PTPA) protein